MSGTKTDYSNTIFYKIYCKDQNVKDIYIGHTVDFVKRKYSHRHSCICPNAPNHNCKLYNVIRKHDGWNNWIMEIVGFHKCCDLSQARKHEQDYFEHYDATLNSVAPFPRETARNSQRDIHNKSQQNLVSDGNVSKHFYCELCDYRCRYKSDYDKHLSTTKHKSRTQLDENSSNIKFLCDCGKVYKARNSLWYHKKKCTFNVSLQDEGSIMDCVNSSDNDYINDN